MRLTAVTSASCAEVKAEIEDRVNNMAEDAGWVDPHNGGIYTLISSSDGLVSTQRTTNPATSVGGKLYTDKQNFVLTDTGSGCEIKACSQSQGFSVGDLSTNYCNLRNLYCGSKDGCKPA